MVRKLPQVISEKEFLEVLKGTEDKKYKMAFILGFYQAMRVSEVAKLRPEHIDRERGFIRIVQGKGKKDADIPIMPPTFQALRSGFKHIPIGVGVRQLQRAFKTACKSILSKDNLSFHTLRHSGATFWLNEKKVDMRNIQGLLRHSRITTTEIYTHINPGSMKKVFEEAWENE